MRKILFIGLVSLAFAPAGTEEDIFVIGNSREKIEFILQCFPKMYGNLNYEKQIVPLTEFFLQTPYMYSLSPVPDSKILVDVESVDCVTFVENILSVFYALAHEKSFDTYINYLMRIRYYNGDFGTINNRIHYFSEALHEMQRTGMGKDALEGIGYPYHKKINYMTANSAKYSVDDWERIHLIEQWMSRVPQNYLQKENIDEYLKIAHSGDVIGFTTTVSGLDVSHCGIAIVKDDGVYLAHASSKFGKVILHQKLKDYLNERTSLTGILVTRPLFN